MPNLSVILCSHEPRRDYFARTIDSLRTQTLPHEQWEFLIVENHPKKFRAAESDYAWHPAGRVVVEDHLGLVHARLRGWRETSGALLVFIDDDNVLAPDYLEVALRLAGECGHLGSFGGSIEPEFEEKPAAGVEMFLPALALRRVDAPRWSNQAGDSEPFGAGMCVRRSCMDAFAAWAENDPRVLLLGRVGPELSSCEDNAIARSGRTHGLGWGIFPELRLTHLIPASRVKLEYLERLVQNICAYGHLLLAIEYGPYSEPKQSRSRTWFTRCVGELELWFSSASYRALRRAERRGQKKGHDLVKRVFGPPKK